MYCTHYKHYGHNENTCWLLLKNTHDDDRLEEVAGDKFNGDLRQLLNENRDLNGRDKIAGDQNKTTGNKDDILVVMENPTATNINTHVLKMAHATVEHDGKLVQHNEAVDVVCTGADFHDPNFIIGRDCSQRYC